MTDPRDEDLARIYASAEAPEPPQRLDDAILAASRRAAGSRPGPVRSVRPWYAPVALAATVVLTATVSLMTYELETRPLAEIPEPAPPAAKPVERQPVEQPREEKRRAASAQPKASEPPAAVMKQEAAPAAASRADEAKVQELRRDAPAENPGSISAERGRRPEAAAAAPAPAPRPQAAPMRAAPSSAGVAARLSRFSEATLQAPDKWIEAIRKLKEEGNTADAARELAEFRRRYPDYPLPADLAQL